MYVTRSNNLYCLSLQRHIKFLAVYFLNTHGASLHNVILWYLFFIIFVVILLTRKKATEALYIGQAVPRPAFGDAEILFSGKNFVFGFLVLERCGWSLELLATTAKQCRKASFPRTQQNGARRFWTETMSITIPALWPLDHAAYKL